MRALHSYDAWKAGDHEPYTPTDEEVRAAADRARCMARRRKAAREPRLTPAEARAMIEREAKGGGQ
jgi:hypothetical protein